MGSPSDFRDVGLWVGISFEEYLQWPGLNKSRLWTMCQKTPAHYRYEIDHPLELDTPAMELGRAVHMAILEPHRFEGAYAVGGPVNPRTEKPYGTDTKAWKNWEDEMCKPILSQADLDRCLFVRDAVHSCAAARRLLEKGRAETSMQWHDEATGMLLKGRPDWWIHNAGVVVDLKTCECAAPTPFGRMAYRYGYHFQAALYQDGAAQAAETDVEPPVIIAVEKTPPYCVAVYQVGKEELELGRIQYRFALDKAQKCTRVGVWPGYEEGLLTLMLPPWAGTELAADAEIPDEPPNKTKG